MGGEFGDEWIHVYVWMSPFAETITILISYISIQNKKLKKKKKNSLPKYLIKTQKKHVWKF